jgi:hypothetical protein
MITMYSCNRNVTLKMAGLLTETCRWKYHNKNTSVELSAFCWFFIHIITVNISSLFLFLSCQYVVSQHILQNKLSHEARFLTCIEELRTATRTAITLSFFNCFLRPSMSTAKQYPKLNHECFLPYNFQLHIPCKPAVTGYTATYRAIKETTKAIWNFSP